MLENPEDFSPGQYTIRNSTKEKIGGLGSIILSTGYRRVLFRGISPPRPGDYRGSPRATELSYQEPSKSRRFPVHSFLFSATAARVDADQRPSLNVSLSPRERPLVQPPPASPFFRRFLSFSKEATARSLHGRISTSNQKSPKIFSQSTSLETSCPPRNSLASIRLDHLW